jgi:acyl-CoA reductase-like NAD-dependent aldehyde dehydrogenase
MAKIQLEMGGKNPLVIVDDADLATAVNARCRARISRPDNAAPRRRA